MKISVIVNEMKISTTIKSLTMTMMITIMISDDDVWYEL